MRVRTMFTDRSVFTKILVAVALALAVAVGIGADALVDLAASARASHVIAHDSLDRVDSASRLKLALERMRSDLRETALAPTRQLATERYASLAREQADWDTAIKALHRSGLSARTRRDAERVATDMATYQDLQQRTLVPLAESDDAAGFFTAEAAAAPTAQKVLDDVDLLISQEKAEAHARAADAQHTFEVDRLAIITALVLGVTAALAMGIVIARSIATGAQRVSAVADGLAHGNLTLTCALSGRDELGRMGASLDAGIASLREAMTMVAETSQSVAASATELSASASQIAAAAEETSAQSGVVSVAAEEVSASVTTVAAGAEEMGTSIREIAQSAAEAARVANRAVDVADDTTSRVAKLGESSAEIGEFVKVITTIAEQTNLLALNATIEAARAGEAGKGFAVVAGEVKELAQETARATDVISARVSAIQLDTEGAVHAISGFSDIVGSINAFQATIASAVEEQTAVTAEISRSITEAATGSTEIAANISGVAQAADLTTEALTMTTTAVRDLAEMAEALKMQVQRFQL